MSKTSQSTGETLAQKLERGRLDTQVALSVLEQLLTILEPVHAGGGAHGRITPSLVSFTADDQVRLAGLPGSKPDGKAKTAADTVPTEPEYTAPEQINGDPVDARADVYALGVLAYEMLTGRNPFLIGEQASRGTVIYRILYRPYPQIAPGTYIDLPEPARLALTTAMSKDPRARYPDAQSFLIGLREPPQPAEAPLVVFASPPAKTPGRWSKFVETFAYWRFEVRRTPAPYVIAAILLIAGLAVAIFVVLDQVKDGAVDNPLGSVGVSTTVVQPDLATPQR